MRLVRTRPAALAQSLSLSRSLWLSSLSHPLTGRPEGGCLIRPWYVTVYFGIPKTEEGGERLGGVLKLGLVT